MAIDKKPTVTLKRNVTVKAIVTDNYKKFLITELNKNILALEVKIKDLDKQLKHPETSQLYKNQVSREKQKSQLAIEALMQKINATKALKEGQITTQGKLEGMTNITLGDNLYNKIGAMEILIRDGIVEDIKVIEKAVIE